MKNDSYDWFSQATPLQERADCWRDKGVIGVDTEFMRERTFFPILSLIQVGDGDNVTLIDPLELTEVETIQSLLQDPDITKIMHSCSEDLDAFATRYKPPIRNIFDTQIAAALLGLGPALGYQALLELTLGITVEKGETRSDWQQRPLTQNQLHYAAEDVRYLPQLHAHLTDRLQALGRLEWVQEDCAKLTPMLDVDPSIEQQYEKFKHCWKMPPWQRALVHALLSYRESAARGRDLPRNRIFSNQAIYEIVEAQPNTLHALNHIEALSHPSRRHHGQAIIDVVAEVAGLDEDQCPPAPTAPLPPGSRSTLKALKSIVDQEATALDIAPETLVSKKDLVHLLQTGELNEKLSGWRKEVVGQQLQDYLAKEESHA